MRTTRLGHPPVLFRDKGKDKDKERLVYGPGVNAPWNAGPTAAGAPAAGTGGKGGKDGANGKEGSPSQLLPDAKMYATWNWEQKDFRSPLPHKGRSRMGSVSILGGPSNGISRRLSVRSDSSAS